MTDKKSKSDIEALMKLMEKGYSKHQALNELLDDDKDEYIDDSEDENDE